MKNICVAIIMSVTIVFSAHADSISRRWDKTYGYGQSWATSVQQTMDGGYIVAGRTVVYGGINFYIVKLDYSGAVVWQKVYGGNAGGEAALSISQTFDGGYIVAGWTLSFGYGISTLVLKLDGTGNVVWQRAYGGAVQATNTSIKQTVDGGYIMISGTDAFGQGIVVAKLDAHGEITWQKFYGYFAMQTYSEYQYPIFQTSDGGYIFATNEQPYGFGIVKLDADGNIVWQKTYGGGRLDAATAIEETSDGGYIVSGATYSFGAGEDDFWILKLDNSGDIAWQKTYGGDSWDFATSVKQTAEGGYIVVGGSSSFGGETTLWILNLDSIGAITWQKVYLERKSGSWPAIEKTSDGGYIVAGSSSTLPANAWFIWLLKMDSNGEVPGCNILSPSYVIPSDTYATVRDGTATVSAMNLAVAPIDIVSHTAYQPVSEICQYDDPADVDADGVENIPAGGSTAINNNTLVLANEDNCLTTPNGPFLGTCSKGNVGASCIAHAACGADGFCSMNQEDSYPPQGNGIGDTCECEGDFDCDADTDGTDAATFKTDFGRSAFSSPCIATDTCNGDFSCDGDVDGSDAALFKSDFGRSTFNNPCPVCVSGVEWCTYP